MSTVTVTESSSHPISVLGVGLTSPFGVTARDHAFFLRGRLVRTMPPPFVDAEGELVMAHYCRWLGARLPIAERMERMALSALTAATASSLDSFDSGWDVALVVESPRIGLDDVALSQVRAAAQTVLSGKRANYSVFRGAGHPNVDPVQLSGGRVGREKRAFGADPELVMYQLEPLRRTCGGW